MNWTYLPRHSRRALIDCGALIALMLCSPSGWQKTNTCSRWKGALSWRLCIIQPCTMYMYMMCVCACVRVGDSVLRTHNSQILASYERLHEMWECVRSIPFCSALFSVADTHTTHSKIQHRQYAQHILNTQSSPCLPTPSLPQTRSSPF